MTPRVLRGLAIGCAALIVLMGAGFPIVAARAVGAVASTNAIADGVVASLAPALGLWLVIRQARVGRLASWSALVGSALTVGLGIALYAAALGGTRPGATALAVSFVPLRQLVAVAVTAWAVWISRSVRDRHSPAP